MILFWIRNLKKHQNNKNTTHLIKERKCSAFICVLLQNCFEILEQSEIYYQKCRNFNNNNNKIITSICWGIETIAWNVLVLIAKELFTFYRVQQVKNNIYLQMTRFDSNGRHFFRFENNNFYMCYSILNSVYA